MSGSGRLRPGLCRALRERNASVASAIEILILVRNECVRVFLHPRGSAETCAARSGAITSGHWPSCSNLRSIRFVRSILFGTKHIDVEPQDVAAVLAEFQAIGEDPEKFAAFVNGAERKNRARASPRPRSDPTTSANELSSHEAAHL